MALSLVDDRVDEWEHRNFENPPSELLPDHFVSPVEVRNSPPLRFVPALTPSGQLDAVLYGQGNHRLPQLTVVTAEELQVHHVTTATTSIAPPASRWVEVEGGCLIFVVRQRATPRKPSLAAEWLQIGVAACDLLDGYSIANCPAASVKSIGGVRWAML